MQKDLKVFTMVNKELDSARSKYTPFNSAHEGYATILEELDELWDEIKKQPDKRSMVNMRKEAVQVAAMAIRFIHDVCYSDDSR